MVAACNGDDVPQIALHPDGSAGAAAGGGKDGAPDVSVGDAGAADASDTGAPDAPFSPVLLGVAPVPRAPTAGDAWMAELEVLGAGSRGIPYVRRWATLFQDGAIPNTQEWDRLASSGAQIRAAGRSLLLCLALVDRTLDARPMAVKGQWDSPSAKSAVEALIDRTLATLQTELAYVALGNEVDRYFTQVSASERASFVALLAHALDYGRTHPGKPIVTRFGLSVSFGGAVSGLPSEILDVARSGDAVIVSYLPLDESHQVKSPSIAAADLDALAVALAADAGPSLPIALQEVGYPSSTVTGSSEEKQKTFFDAFFQALGARRERFPFVGVTGLYDAPAAACEAEAAALGGAGNAALTAARCSLGLRKATGEAKAAEKSVLNALATFATP